MQETEHSVPLERLAGTMPFQGLRKPLAAPGGLTCALLHCLLFMHSFCINLCCFMLPVRRRKCICEAVEQGCRERAVKIAGENGIIGRRSTSMGKGQRKDVCRKARRNTAFAAPETA